MMPVLLLVWMQGKGVGIPGFTGSCSLEVWFSGWNPTIRGASEGRLVVGIGQEAVFAPQTSAGGRGVEKDKLARELAGPDVCGDYIHPDKAHFDGNAKREGRGNGGNSTYVVMSLRKDSPPPSEGKQVMFTPQPHKWIKKILCLPPNPNPKSVTKKSFRFFSKTFPSYRRQTDYVCPPTQMRKVKHFLFDVDALFTRTSGIRGFAADSVFPSRPRSRSRSRRPPPKENIHAPWCYPSAVIIFK